MFGIGSNSRYGLEFVLAGLALIGLVAGVALRADDDVGYTQRAIAQQKLGRCQRIAPKADPRTAAYAEYKAGRFAEAAAIVAAVRPTDVDLQNLALQYERLARTWAVGTNRATPSIDAFEALREARKLDLVLGGVHSDQLDLWARSVVTKAAVAYMARKDYANAELAVHAADMLGVSNDTTAVVGEQIAHEVEVPVLDHHVPDHAR